MTEHPLKWGDAQQYHAEPHPNYAGEEHGVLPTVHLQWMTPDPLGAMAMATGMYEGKVFRHILEVTDADRRRAWDNMLNTHLTAGLEVIRFQFLFDGVDRAFTHQDVRQRTAVFFQESLRFAVPGDLSEATTLPPSLQGTQRITPQVPEDGYDISQKQAWRRAWESALNTIDAIYHYLVETGMPAEEARGLLPHCTATRIVHNTDLRNLVGHAGNRLCTQAQFHWRLVFAGIVDAIRNYEPLLRDQDDVASGEPVYLTNDHDRWQYELIADSNLFRPACYQMGRCPFKAEFDRACSIRGRVDAFAAGGVPSQYWEGDPQDHVFCRADGEMFDGIRVEEWLLNPAAARL